HDDRIASLRPLPEAAFAEEDARMLEIQTGDYVDLQSEEGTIHDLLVEVRRGLRPGTVVLIAGLPDDPSNVLPEGARVRASNPRRIGAMVEA
ncbi:MAG TPA: hypothetical protein VMV73_02245, partial [Candidatus Dormibacteraeota bacterium]|nr:hypothetical protein [Candidatus Dormibacteraeota bacterium]